MGRRRKRASFLPDIYVFPGGRVDAADRVALPEALRLAEDTERLLRRDTPKASPLALALAALRETHEETGYLVARPAGPAMLDSLPDTPFWNACRQAEVVPDLAAMGLCHESGHTHHLPQEVQHAILPCGCHGSHRRAAP